MASKTIEEKLKALDEKEARHRKKEKQERSGSSMPEEPSRRP